jgi:hypothetical protein
MPRSASWANGRSWIERLAQLPEVYWGEGWVATHAGFDPVTWKPQLNIRLPFWQSYDGRYGEVVVGHTPGPHVRRIGRIVLVDTGACYGGQLSAYCPETGEVHQTAGLNPWNGTGFPSLSARSRCTAATGLNCWPGCWPTTCDSGLPDRSTRSASW